MGCATTAVTAAVLVTTATVAFACYERRQVLKLADEKTAESTPAKASFWRELAWLSGLLWGGAGLLILRHLWLGEALDWLAVILADFNLGVFVIGLSMFVWTGMLLLSLAKKKRQRRIET
ncbi:MAG: hypothetical protein FWB76_01770 [Oscillospiraceae bacterium]|nr:hypothetical protein [Oscillospiraceae bacterium]